VVFFFCFRESFGGFDQGAASREFSQRFEVDESTREGGEVGAGKDCVECVVHWGLNPGRILSDGVLFD
jgi:hypothetical protein